VGDTDDAFDVCQAVWLTVHRQLSKLTSPNAFRVWLYRIAHDQAVSALRKRSREPLFTETCDEADIPDQPDNEVTFDNAELVHVALQSLTVDHRRVLTLRFLEDMDVNEISEVLGCSPGTVKSRLFYARDALRRRIEELTHE
jgi:RNA polymerase sigma-70 factor (ECF subfamily)